MKNNLIPVTLTGASVFIRIGVLSLSLIGFLTGTYRLTSLGWVSSGIGTFEILAMLLIVSGIRDGALDKISSGCKLSIATTGLNFLLGFIAHFLYEYKLTVRELLVSVLSTAFGIGVYLLIIKGAESGFEKKSLVCALTAVQVFFGIIDLLGQISTAFSTGHGFILPVILGLITNIAAILFYSGFLLFVVVYKPESPETPPMT